MKKLFCIVLALVVLTSLLLSVVSASDIIWHLTRVFNGYADSNQLLMNVERTVLIVWWPRGQTYYSVELALKNEQLVNLFSTLKNASVKTCYDLAYYLRTVESTGFKPIQPTELPEDVVISVRGVAKWLNLPVFSIPGSGAAYGVWKLKKRKNARISV